MIVAGYIEFDEFDAQTCRSPPKGFGQGESWGNEAAKRRVVVIAGRGVNHQEAISRGADSGPVFRVVEYRADEFQGKRVGKKLSD